MTLLNTNHLPSLAGFEAGGLRKRGVKVVTEYVTSCTTVVEKATKTIRESATKPRSAKKVKSIKKAQSVKKSATKKTRKSKAKSKVKSKPKSSTKVKAKVKSGSKKGNTTAQAYNSASTAVSLCAVPVVRPASLSAHNKLRAKHGAKDLVWDSGLQKLAQKWAEKCVFQDGGGDAVRASSNVAAISGTGGTTQEQVAIWSDEAKDYDSSDPQYSHFTQMVGIECLMLLVKSPC